jgi:hypothetical protein
MEVVELCAGAIQVAVMVEQVQTAKHLLFTATNKIHDPFGSDVAVLRDVAEDFEIALGELK